MGDEKRVFSRRNVVVAVLSSMIAGGPAACAELKANDPSAAANADAGADAASEGAAEEPSPFEIVRLQPLGDEILSIWGFDDRTAFAVGTGGLHLTMMDGQWIRAANEPGRNYWQVWGPRYEDMYCVGEIVGTHKGIIQHWDGVQWSDEYIAPTPIYGVYSDGIVVLAVSTDGRIYGKAVGTTDWAQRTQLTEPTRVTLNGIVGNGKTNITLVSDSRIYHTTSLKYWAWMEPLVDPSIRFTAAWAPAGAETDVFIGTNYLGFAWMYGPGHAPAVGSDAGLLTEPDGSVEEEQIAQMYRDESEPNAADLAMRGIFGYGTKRIVVGDLARIYVFDMRTGDTTRVPAPAAIKDTLRTAWGNKDGVWIAGSRELILHGKWP